jgi:hypothetical protein
MPPPAALLLRGERAVPDGWTRCRCAYLLLTVYAYAYAYAQSAGDARALGRPCTRSALPSTWLSDRPDPGQRGAARPQTKSRAIDRVGLPPLSAGTRARHSGTAIPLPSIECRSPHPPYRRRYRVPSRRSIVVASKEPLRPARPRRARRRAAHKGAARARRHPARPSRDVDAVTGGSHLVRRARAVDTATHLERAVSPPLAVSGLGRPRRLRTACATASATTAIDSAGRSTATAVLAASANGPHGP